MQQDDENNGDWGKKYTCIVMHTPFDHLNYESTKDFLILPPVILVSQLHTLFYFETFPLPLKCLQITQPKKLNSITCMKFLYFFHFLFSILVHILLFPIFNNFSFPKKESQRA